MSMSSSVRLAVRYALMTSAAAAPSATAYAQEQNIQEVVVTGSRIAQPNLETTSPVTQVTAEDVVTQGVTKIEDLVNQLPQAFAAQNATVANGATGTATVNLRGLGSARTLVLVDGRRMPYGDATNSAADLNQIPTAMVERVEILTGGASAVYGSDAIAGVVNFIMKKDFEGVQVGAQYSLYHTTTTSAVQAPPSCATSSPRVRPRVPRSSRCLTTTSRMATACSSTSSWESAPTMAAATSPRTPRIRTTRRSCSVIATSRPARSRRALRRIRLRAAVP